MTASNTLWWVTNKTLWRICCLSTWRDVFLCGRCRATAVVILGICPRLIGSDYVFQVLRDVFVCTDASGLLSRCDRAVEASDGWPGTMKERCGSYIVVCSQPVLYVCVCVFVRVCVRAYVYGYTACMCARLKLMGFKIGSEGKRATANQTFLRIAFFRVSNRFCGLLIASFVPFNNTKSGQK